MVQTIDWQLTERWLFLVWLIYNLYHLCYNMFMINFEATFHNNMHLKTGKRNVTEIDQLAKAAAPRNNQQRHHHQAVTNPELYKKNPLTINNHILTVYKYGSADDLASHRLQLIPSHRCISRSTRRRPLCACAGPMTDDRSRTPIHGTDWPITGHWLDFYNCTDRTAEQQRICWPSGPILNLYLFV